MEVIQDIRRGYGVDRPGDVPIQGVLERALDHLSDQLYRSDSHFIMEFIQNADDNTYPVGIIPTLHIRVEDFKVTMTCNEVGFSEKNVRSICNIGDSTKKNNRGFIGEKGIGFKSVFKVADVVHVVSGPYAFKFDRKAKLGMIAPIWDGPNTSSVGQTTFTLDLSSPPSNCPPPGMSIGQQSEGIKPSLLLFLRKLCSIEIDVAVSDTKRRHRIHISRKDLDSNIIQLTRAEGIPNTVNAVDLYFTVKDTVLTSDLQEERRLGIKETEIILAFPVNEHRLPKLLPQDVFAFLPMRKFGFNFLIQADFLTSSSREDVLEYSLWNLRIRDAVVRAFIKGVYIFLGHPELRDTWIRFLPQGIVDRFFSDIETTLIAKLKTLKVVRDSTGSYQVPGRVLFVPSRFYHRGRHLISYKYMHLCYLSEYYEQSLDAQPLRLLGVRDMTHDDFLDGLVSMITSTPTKFHEADGTWHDSVCSLLINVRTTSRRTFDQRILNLRILPLDDGSWAQACEANRYMFDAEVSSVPEHVDYRRVSRTITPGSQRYIFFSSLGVCEANPALIAQVILDADGHSIKSHIDNARFFFLHRNSIHPLPDPSRLRFVDECGISESSNMLYLDLPQDVGRLRKALQASSAWFIHPEYMTQFLGKDFESWMRWLYGSSKLNIAPRLVNNRLSREFEEMTINLGLRELLVILRNFWNRWPNEKHAPWKRQLSCTPVTLDDGSRSTLGSMFLRRGTIAYYSEIGNYFVPVSDPESSDWDFLNQLGVVTAAGALLYLRLLIHHQILALSSLVEVTNIYKQLDARFYEESEEILKAFKDRPIIYIEASTWIHRSEIYWDGPQSMSSKIRLCSIYPSLADFFNVKLRIPNAPPSIILDELKEFSSLWHGKAIGEEPQHRAVDLLAELGNLIKSGQLSDADVYNVLKEHAIFPASGQKDEVHLCKLSEIYIPDRDERYAKAFRGKVKMLDLSVIDHMPSGISILLRSSACEELVKNIELCVDQRTYSEGNGVRHLPTIALITRNYEFIERLLRKGSKPSKRQLEVLSKIKAIDILIVDSISSTLTLENITLTLSELMDFSEGESSFIVKISKNVDATDVLMETCRYLSRLLHLGILPIYQIVTSDQRELSILFRLEEIDELACGTFGDVNWLSQNHDIIPISRDGPQSELVDLKAADFNYAHGNALLMTDDMHNEIGQIIDSFSAVPRTKVDVPSTVANVLGLDQSPQDKGTPAHLPIASTFGLVGTSTRALNLNRFQQVNGVLGELHVYAHLSKIIGTTFGPRNWTSSLRGCVRGFEPYNGSSLADFTYVDQNGILTEYLYKDDQNMLKMWSRRWPKYHIEVKSTSGNAREPFHMSRKQFDIALALMFNNKGGNIPEDIENVYVIVRVWNVRSSRDSMAFFADPIGAIMAGRLRIASDKIELMIGN